ncbi:MAG: serine hydrolase [Gammaproteobacteria bacterium]|nr:serine hydrolase [Gammaproteobacteria bacterium]
MEIQVGIKNGFIKGRCDEKFQPVLDEFVRNFNARNELGASVCINVAGETLVDLWGGMKSPGKEAASWEEDTISVVFSCTKAATALCAHMLIDQGKLELNAPVAEYWPEFASHGKEQATVAMMLNHSVGVPALREPVKEGGFLDWDYMSDRLAQEEPFWKPGTRNGYHMMTFGWTVGELVRRVSGQSLGTFFRNNIAKPLHLDFWIGLPESEFGRVSRTLRWRPEKGQKPAPFTMALLNDPNSLQYLAFLNNGRHKTDSPDSYRTEYGAGGGIGNGRSLAAMYTPLANGGLHNDVKLLSNDHIERMRAVSVATSEDATLLMPSRFGLGFMLSMDNRNRESGYMETLILGQQAFGHAGAGGSDGFADTEANLAFGYSMNRMGAGILLNERGQSLVDAVYRCLGYRTDSPGFWIK